MKKFDLTLTTMIHQVKSFSFVFLENLGHHKLLSKLTDLYQLERQICKLEAAKSRAGVSNVIVAIPYHSYIAYIVH